MAIECIAKRTLHLRRRGANDALDAALKSVVNWPEITEWPSPHGKGRRAVIERLRGAAAGLFEAWCRDAVRRGRRYTGAAEAFDHLDEVFDFMELRRKVIRFLRHLLPTDFLPRFHMSSAEWFEMPNPAAATRAFNQQKSNDAGATSPDVELTTAQAT